MNHEDIVGAVQDIPEDQLDMLDVFVLEEVIVPSRWKVGTKCIAKWSEDNTWYNGVVSAVNSDESYLVQFIDYGNEEIVPACQVVELAEDIPEVSSVDQWVKHEGDECTDEFLQLENNEQLKEPHIGSNEHLLIGDKQVEVNKELTGC